MTVKNQWAEAKGPRTKSWKSNPTYDNFIGDLDMSSLRVLKKKRKNDLHYFTLYHDMKLKDNKDEYYTLRQTYSMIKEEIYTRTVNNRIIRGYDEWFDSETGLVVGQDGQPCYSITYNEDEDKIIYDGYNNIPEEYEDEIDKKPNRLTDWKQWWDDQDISDTEYDKQED